MKRIILYFVAAILLTVTSCDAYLDIKPLGKTTLDKVDDLETLLNNVPIISIGDDYINDMAFLCGDIYEPWTGISESLSNKSSLMYAYMTFDTGVDRADLTPESSFYERMYQRINYMNVVISKMPTATDGTEDKKEQLVAEARILRAWYHYLLVNRYAQQYDVSTAANLGGVAYVDNTDVSEQKTKLTLEQTYQRILEDCSEEVIADLIQGHVSDPCRFGSDFGYAVRARVLLQMKNYSEALIYANKALEVHSKLEDRSTIKTTNNWIYTYNADNNYYLIYSNNSNMGDYGGIVISPSIASLISPEDYLYKYYIDGTGAEPLPAWNEGDDVYPETPVGCMQCNVWDIHFNTLGLRTESMLFAAAESHIRTGNILEAMRLLDTFRLMRIENPEPYTDIAITLDEKQAMKLLQDNKRLEFVVTFENFFDRKRWNSEPDYAETITRDLNATQQNPDADYGIYTLAPDSPIWVFPFPANAVNYNESLTQNY